MKTFSFRFDVDSHVGLKKGIPKLLSLSNEFNVPFTFFISMGKAISWKGKINSLFKSNENQNYSKLTIVEKLGYKGLIKVLLLNPEVGSSNIPLIREIIDQGHEVALHGGKNHGTWLHKSHTWDKGRYYSEIKWAFNKLQKSGLDQIHGFASPGWKGSEIAYEILNHFDFTYVADNYGKDIPDIHFIPGLNLIQIQTNILGEPGGVGYLEYCRANGIPDREILNDIDESILTRNTSILYDHPAFAGCHEIPLLRKIITLALSRDVRICKMNDIANSIR